MSPTIIRHLIVSFFLAMAGFIPAFAQTTITVNGAPCAGATVTHGLNSIAINTANCAGAAATAPTITSLAPPATGSVGVAYSHTLTASGTTPITWTVTSGALPAGLLLSGATISGTPTTAGSFTFAVTASNGTAPNSVSPNYPVTINVVPPVITSAATLQAATGVAFTHTFAANQVIPAGGWAIVLPGGPPAWATFSSSGTLSGTPQATDLGTTTFSVIATNTNGPSPAQSVSLTVSPPTAPTITSGAPTANGTIGSAYSFAFAASGTAPITWSVTGGTQPAGLTLNPSTGVLSGTPTTAGTYTFAVQAANGTNPNAIAPAAPGVFTVTIAAPGTGVFSIENSLIPEPSKIAKVLTPLHTGANGAGANVNAWAVNPTRCSNTQPAITTSWHHNIDFADHGGKQNLDYFDMAPNEALTYQFVATTPGVGSITIGDSTQAPLVSTFISLSSSPCDFDVTKLIMGPGRSFCYSAQPLENQLAYEVTNGPVSFVLNCKLIPGNTYYLNVRFHNGVNPADTCAPRGGARCGGWLQIRR